MSEIICYIFVFIYSFYDWEQFVRMIVYEKVSDMLVTLAGGCAYICG